jgi:glycosyltransferase involved in cell wall biosynthesis
VASPTTSQRQGKAAAPVAIVHDYLTQRGGAERVVLSLAEAFPSAPIFTSLYEPDDTFPAFGDLDITTSPLNRIGLLRAHHRLAMPLLAPAMSRLSVDADVAICSSSGWAHGVPVTGRKIVYCHTPARWLYQADRYLAGSPPVSSALLGVLSPPLRRWDHRAAATADRYLVNSRAVQARVADLYAIDAEIVYPPVDLDTTAEAEPVTGVEPGCILCVSRLLPYKNVEAVVEAFADLPDLRLVVVGSGPLEDQLAAGAGPNVSVLGRVSDAHLRWLYASCLGLVAASYEDFGLTPVEAASFGKPTAALRWGGFLDTIVEGVTGIFFDEPQPRQIAEAVTALVSRGWDTTVLTDHAAMFSAGRFVDEITRVVDEEGGQLA